MRSLDKRTEIESLPCQSTQGTVRPPLFFCVIPGRCIVKKNTQRIVRRGGRPRAVYSKRFIEWNKAAIVRLKDSHCDGSTPRDPIDQAIEVEMRFYLANRQSEPDLSNMIEGPQDALKDAGVIVDDRLIQKLRASKHVGHQARVEIEIYALEMEP